MQDSTFTIHGQKAAGNQSRLIHQPLKKNSYLITVRHFGLLTYHKRLLMSFIWFILVGLAAGTIAKMITPQQEKGGWISTLIIGVIGAAVGGWIAGMLPIIKNLADIPLLGSLLTATGGAFLVLWIYHKFLADKLNLPV